MTQSTLPVQAIPPLETGDHLSRAEFERRFEAMPHLKKAELIQGVVYMPSPVRQDRHASQHASLLTWLGVYWAATPGVEAGDNASLRLDQENMLQPDALLRMTEQCGGQARIDSDGFIVGGPELVVEIAASSVSLDRNKKLQVYRTHGVREYLIWRVLDNALDWFQLQDKQFHPLLPTTDGYHHSKVFPGLWLDAAALLRFDLAEVLRVLQTGLASAEHSAFLDTLRSRLT